MNRDCKATLDDSVREEIERVLAPQDYSAAADSILEGIRESWMSDEDFTAMKEAFGNMTGLTREKLANDLAAGVAKGHSIDLQVMLAKTMIANLLNLGNNAASALLDRFEPAGPTVVVVPDIAKQTGSFTVKCDSPRCMACRAVFWTTFSRYARHSPTKRTPTHRNENHEHDE